jgi:hypothetical protein
MVDRVVVNEGGEVDELDHGRERLGLGGLPASHLVAEEQELVGVLYWLGRAQEELGDREEARVAYGRVAAADAGFRDVADRLREF